MSQTLDKPPHRHTSKSNGYKNAQTVKQIRTQRKQPQLTTSVFSFSSSSDDSRVFTTSPIDTDIDARTKDIFQTVDATEYSTSSLQNQEPFYTRYETIKSIWNASAFRRSIAHVCYAWRSLQTAHVVLPNKYIDPMILRNCFHRPTHTVDASVQSWFDTMTLIYDTWKHVDLTTRSTDQNTLFMTVRMGVFEGDLFLNGWSTDESQIVSSLLTNLSSFAREFGQVRESDWFGERLVKYESSDGKHIITTRMTNNTPTHTIETIEESLLCKTPRQDGFCVSIESSRSATPLQIPPIAMPSLVEIRQSKTFEWHDSSYAHTVVTNKSDTPIVWKATLSLVWQGKTMLQTDGHMASRQPPRVELMLTTGPLRANVVANVAAEMTLQTCSAIYTMASVALMPQDRDEWVWSMLDE